MQPNRFAVPRTWTDRQNYHSAVLSSPQRITLDGEPAEPVDDWARDRARERLARIKERRKVREHYRAAEASNRKAVPAAAPARTAAAESSAPPAPPRHGLADLKAAWRERQR
jgi:sRNA-binding protein